MLTFYVFSDDLKLFISSGGNRLLVVYGLNSVLIWEADEPVFTSRRDFCRGLWTQAMPSDGIVLPERNFIETSVDAHFYDDSVRF